MFLLLQKVMMISGPVRVSGPHRILGLYLPLCAGQLFSLVCGCVNVMDFLSIVGLFYAVGLSMTMALLLCTRCVLLFVMVINVFKP